MFLAIDFWCLWWAEANKNFSGWGRLDAWLEHWAIKPLVAYLIVWTNKSLVAYRKTEMRIGGEKKVRFLFLLSLAHDKSRLEILCNAKFDFVIEYIYIVKSKNKDPLKILKFTKHTRDVCVRESYNPVHTSFSTPSMNSYVA